MVEVEVLVRVLEASLSQDGATRKAAEAELERLQNSGGCLLALLFVARQTHQLPGTLCVLASVVFKNSVLKTWSKRDVIPEEERGELRQQLLRNLDEPQRQISVQLNLALANMARVDWPRSWEELFPALLGYIDEQDLLKTRRGLQATLGVLKELNTKRMPADKMRFRELCTQLIDGVHALWVAQLGRLLASDATQDTLEQRGRGEVVLAASKILHILVAYGYSEETFASGAQPRKLLQELCVSPVEANLLQQCQNASAARRDASLDARARPLVESLTKTLRALLRLVNDAQEKKTLGFAAYLQPFLEKGCRNSIMFMQSVPSVVAQQSGFFDEKLAVLCVTFLTNVLNCNEYKLSNSAEEPRGAGKLITAQGDVDGVGTMQSAQAAHVVLEQFWTNDRVCEVARNIVLRALVLSTEDLEEWTTNPEEFAMREEEQSASRVFRPACENLLLALVDAHPEPTCATLLELLKQSESETIEPGPNLSSQAAAREAVYASIGICAYWLHEKLPFRAWVERSLLPLLGETREGLSVNVLRSRVLWLLGCLPPEEYDDKQGALFEFLLSLVENDSTDLVVRIQAMRAVQRLLESWCFVPNLFAPFQTRAIRAAMKLSSQCELSSTHIGIIATVSVLVTRVEEAILRSLPDLFQPISSLWASHEGSDWSLWKIAVLRLLENVAEKIGEAEQLDTDRKFAIILELQGLLLPLVAVCTDTQNPDFVYLGEPAVDLWAAIAKATARYTPEMHALTRRLPSLLSSLGTDVTFFTRVLDIFEAHLLSAATDIVRDFGADTLLPLFDTYLARGVLKVQQEIRLLRSLEILLRSQCSELPRVLAPVLQRLATVVLDAGSASNGLDQQLHVTYLSILARLVFEFGPQGVSASVNGLPMLQLIDAWLSHYKDIGGAAYGVWRRKLWTLVLCSQLSETLARRPWSSGDQSAIGADRERFTAVLHVWADIRADLASEKQNEVAAKRALEAMGASKPQDGSAMSYFHERKAQSFWADRVVSLNLDNVLRGALRECSNLMPQQILEVFVSSDPVVAALF